jgi:hypothetical protein
MRKPLARMASLFCAVLVLSRLNRLIMRRYQQIKCYLHPQKGSVSQEFKIRPNKSCEGAFNRLTVKQQLRSRATTFKRIVDASLSLPTSIFTSVTKNSSLRSWAWSWMNLTDGAVVRLMTAANPPGAHVTPRQTLQLVQRPLAVENAIDHQCAAMPMSRHTESRTRVGPSLPTVSLSVPRRRLDQPRLVRASPNPRKSTVSVREKGACGAGDRAAGQSGRWAKTKRRKRNCRECDGGQSADAARALRLRAASATELLCEEATVHRHWQPGDVGGAVGA